MEELTLEIECFSEMKEHIVRIAEAMGVRVYRYRMLGFSPKVGGKKGDSGGPKT